MATDRPQLFTVPPVLVLTADRSEAHLRFAVAPGEFGTALATVQLRDSAGAELMQATLITVAAVDEAPTFSLVQEVNPEP